MGVGELGIEGGSTSGKWGRSPREGNDELSLGELAAQGESGYWKGKTRAVCQPCLYPLCSR